MKNKIKSNWLFKEDINFKKQLELMERYIFSNSDNEKKQILKEINLLKNGK